LPGKIEILLTRIHDPPRFQTKLTPLRSRSFSIAFQEPVAIIAGANLQVPAGYKDCTVLVLIKQHRVAC